MPKPVDYKKGALVYFTGDKSDNRIFVLQKGKIILETIDPESNLEVRDVVQPGEFFGVKSAISNLLRDETANVVEDSVVILFTVTEFESFAAGNPRLIFKMLQVFSNQLRRVNKQLSSVLKQKDTDSDQGLYNVGEFFFKKKDFKKAFYVFNKYQEQHPLGKNSGNVEKYLTMLKQKGFES
ncbi:MAG: hypothetical protein Ta2F_12250 [Termitinemataceae bacterium]|nr:MAG: hypothetical protein Ta2F_12250 [Termitinemataceae bacterium]